MGKTSKKIPLAHITTVHLLQPIKYSGTWKRVCETAEAGQFLQALNGKYQTIAALSGFLLQNGNSELNLWLQDMHSSPYNEASSFIFAID